MTNLNKIADVIYLLSNTCMPGYVKVGKTSDLDSRIDALYTTGVPQPFVLERAFRVKDATGLEKTFFKIFAPERVPNREFFQDRDTPSDPRSMIERFVTMILSNGSGIIEEVRLKTPSEQTDDSKSQLSSRESGGIVNVDTDSDPVTRFFGGKNICGNYIRSGLGISGAHLRETVKGRSRRNKKLLVEVRMQRNDASYIYSQLYEKRDVIESALSKILGFDVKLQWDEARGRKYRSIRIIYDGLIDITDESKYTQYRQWHETHKNAMYQVFHSIVMSLKLPPEGLS